MTLDQSGLFEPDTGGVALWRRIADALRLDIAAGVYPFSSRLPGETALATRFAVNRHTVRAALKALERDGLLRSRQGSGTFVSGEAHTSVPIPNGGLVATGLSGDVAGGTGRLIAATIEAANAVVAAALWLHPDELVTRMETLSLVGDRGVARVTHWLSAERYTAIDAYFSELGSMSGALRHYDIDEYVRASTRLSARYADTDETRWLSLAPGAIVMVAEGIDALTDGEPVQLSLSRFAAERVELVVLGE